MITIPYITLRASWLGALTLFVIVQGASAQDRPEPGTGVVQSQNEGVDATAEEAEEDVPKDAGYVRIFNFANGLKDRLAIFLSKGPLNESSAPGDLGTLLRGSKSPDIRNYTAFPGGDYELLVRKEDSAQYDDPTVAPTVYKPGQALLSPMKITVEPKAHYSVFLWSDGGSVKAAVTKDGAAKLRLCNFASASPLEIGATAKDPPMIIASSVAPGISTIPKDNQGASAAYVLIYRTPAGSPAQRLVEMESSAKQGITLVVYNDKYGRMAFRGFADAAAPPAPAPAP